jgi:hypothetical protein
MVFGRTQFFEARRQITTFLLALARSYCQQLEDLQFFPCVPLTTWQLLSLRPDGGILWHQDGTPSLCCFCCTM